MKRSDCTQRNSNPEVASQFLLDEKSENEKLSYEKLEQKASRDAT